MRNVVISGANRGIGRAIAEKILKDGNRLSLGVRNPDDLKNTNLDPQISGKDKILLNKYEAREITTAIDWIQRTKEIFGSIDTLINCAGIFYNTEFLYDKNGEKEINELFKINVMGPWILCKEAWNHLADSGIGRIIVIGSMSGKRSKSNLAGYTMSKFALTGICQTMRNEGWDHGIRITTINPSWVNTDMAANIKAMPKNEMTQPEDIASISSNLLKLTNSCVPFEINLNCRLEK